MTQLLTKAVEAGNEAMTEPPEDYVLSGEHNLLHVQDLSSNVSSLRRLFDLFEQRTALLQLLEMGSRAQGVQIYIGGESGLVPLDECSVVTAPYEVDGEVLGTVGRDRPHPHGLRARDPDRRDHRQAAVDGDGAARARAGVNGARHVGAGAEG